MDIEDRAFTFAIEKHKGQAYGNYDYSYHLSCVVEKVQWLFGEDEVLASIGWLHDSQEDTDATYGEIVLLCGQVVADAVLSVTKMKGESYKDYIKRVKSNGRGLKAKIADTLCNLEESVKIGDIKRVKKYTKQLELLCEE